MERYWPKMASTNGIQEVARSIRVSSTNKIKHLATLSNPTDQRM